MLAPAVLHCLNTLVPLHNSLFGFEAILQVHARIKSELHQLDRPRSLAGAC